MSKSILDQPVHVAILRPTHLRKLQDEGKLPASAVSLVTPDPAPLPAKQSTAPSMPRMELPKMPNILKQTNARVRLQQVHANVQVPTEKPPCNECKTAACCSAFVVGLTQDEYDSGFYEPYAVEFTPEAAEQLQQSYTSVLVGFLPTEGMRKHVMEGRSGEPCPLLRADKRCGVYNNRPAVCRAYTCVGDTRITQAMRDGT